MFFLPDFGAATLYSAANQSFNSPVTTRGRCPSSAQLLLPVRTSA
ncbi:hypothetical protein LILAB_32990 [Corallococcus macrosporus]|uniref:Uncharacterized protein n=1 Tax=Myxococcus fulvus (strain ATCC BAA-855 / HW-1) TaxID=483219 RepID=F8CCE5_MYXFH|nr:hypothetical protein LILAB_32990 [Corallococcus macrosporus]